jgi:hypothetical protein
MLSAVCDQIRRLGEGFSADLAFVWFLAWKKKVKIVEMFSIYKVGFGR